MVKEPKCSGRKAWHIQNKDSDLWTPAEASLPESAILSVKQIKLLEMQ